MWRADYLLIEFGKNLIWIIQIAAPKVSATPIGAKAEKDEIKMLFNRRKPISDTSPAPAAAPIKTGLERTIDGIARQASGLGKESAELNGLIEDLATTGARQKQTFDSLAREIEAMVHANQTIDVRTRASAALVKNARDAVEQVGEGVASVTDQLTEVADAAHEITQLALQTRLIAFNASVEAKRAGEAGRGFGVVAEAVKDLAAKVESSSKLIKSTVEQLDTRIAELAAHIRSDANRQHGATHAHGFDAAVSEVERSVDEIAATARQNLQACAGVLQSVSGLSMQVGDTAEALQGARKRTEGFLSLSESLIDIAAESGVRTEDTPFIEATIAAGAQISALFEEAVRQRLLSMEDLFEERYRPVPGTDPEQFVAPFTQFCEQYVQEHLNAMLSWSPKVIFGIISDVRGYVPSHHKHYARQPGRDPVWNHAHCRNRRFFTGRTEMAAIRSQRRFLLQTYRRDMGGGNHEVMKSLSVPLSIGGRRWGVLRIGYRF